MTWTETSSISRWLELHSITRTKFKTYYQGQIIRKEVGMEQLKPLGKEFHDKKMREYQRAGSMGVTSSKVKG